MTNTSLRRQAPYHSRSGVTWRFPADMPTYASDNGLSSDLSNDCQPMRSLDERVLGVRNSERLAWASRPITLLLRRPSIRQSKPETVTFEARLCRLQLYSWLCCVMADDTSATKVVASPLLTSPFCLPGPCARSMVTCSFLYHVFVASSLSSRCTESRLAFAGIFKDPRHGLLKLPPRPLKRRRG